MTQQRKASLLITWGMGWYILATLILTIIDALS